MKRGEATAARRYARALLEVAFTAAEGNPGTVRRELDEAAGLLRANQALSDALTSPAIDVEAKEKITASVWAEASPLLRRLLVVLVQRNRLELLPAVAAAFTELWNAARGTLPAQASSAVALSTQQQQAVAQALGRLTGRDVELSATVDPELLGGLLVRIGGQIYDGTVRGRLRALRERLSAAD